MPLDEYRDKRHFDKTPEPAGGEGTSAGPARFVVQKHAASRLHYDFRLEADGVLKSWAVPKGPSFDTRDKHLAVEVEDHPLEYGDFEGVIPQGEYGGGTVMVWDRGTYVPRGDFAQMHAAGNIKVDLRGEKLTGGFALVRMKRREREKRDSWLLIKERDEHVRAREDYDVVEAMPDSAKSGRTMEEIAAAGHTLADDAEDADPAHAEGAVAAPLPDALEPELATKVDRVPDDGQWLHEIKLDGYRVLVRADGDDVRFFTRSGADWTSRFAALAPAVRALALGSAWLDGEVTVVRPDGRTSFGALQAELKRGAQADLTYFAFDLPYLRGFDLRDAPLAARKRLLESVLGRAQGRVRYLDHVDGRGPEFHRQTCAYALEGSVSKLASSPYRSGRWRDWRKVKCLGREDFAVVGYTLPRSGGDGVGALVLASRGPSGALAYAGRVGTGWSRAESARLRERLEPLAADDAPIDVPRPEHTGVNWVHPSLVVEVSFAEWTASGVLRHASYEGVREDVSDPPGDGGVVAGVTLTHPDKVLYGGIEVTKHELARYYERVAAHVLPHLENRPLVLVRCPHGESGQCFYQKNVETGFPPSVGRVAVQHEDGIVHYALVDSAEALVALVQLGVLEIHTWGSLADDVERPDRVIIDLDPGPGVAWDAIVAGAFAVKGVMEAAGMTAFLKSTGGKGLHVVTPLVRDSGWTEVRDLAKAIAEAVARLAPEAYTTNPKKAQREGRIFVDYIRNTRGATAVAAYSSRARPGAPVSVPLRWDELRAGIRSDGYDIRSVPDRLAALGADPWIGYDTAAVSPVQAAQRLASE